MLRLSKVTMERTNIVWKVISLPIIGGIIGWVTNLLAIKMLFRPYKGIHIPIINYTVQGLIPKRQKELARIMGEVVEQELLCVEDIIKHIHELDMGGSLADSASSIIKERVMKKIPNFLPLSLRTVVSEIVGDILNKEVPKLIDQLMDSLGENLCTSLQLGKIVEDKINGLDLRQLEGLILTITSKELKHIEYLGFILGFLIGCLQILFVL